MAPIGSAAAAVSVAGTAAGVAGAVVVSPAAGTSPDAEASPSDSLVGVPLGADSAVVCAAGGRAVSTGAAASTIVRKSTCERSASDWVCSIRLAESSSPGTALPRTTSRW